MKIRKNTVTVQAEKIRRFIISKHPDIIIINGIYIGIYHDDLKKFKNEMMEILELLENLDHQEIILFEKDNGVQHQREH
jgi:hypothetical protein